MDKLTKIIATIGPACNSEETIAGLISAGVDVFRFNFKHNTPKWHNDQILLVNRVAKKLDKHVGTLIDLQGPEIRINMPTEEIKIFKDEVLLFGEEAFNSKQKGFSISSPQIISNIKVGQRIVADDGNFNFSFEKQHDKYYLRSNSQGILKNRKSLNIPGADFPFPVLISRDFQALEIAQRNQIDFVALSFVRTEEDIQMLRREMKKYNLQAKVIAKIETKKVFDHLDKIIALSDGIMVARGDMGVELPVEEVPYYQKLIIKQTIKRGIPVITATQMLQSMTENPVPTRAEVSDIANATYDLTDAIMLSAETAIGKYPIEAVDIMRKTASFNEQKNQVDSRVRFQFEVNDTRSVICDAAYGIYMILKNQKKQIAGFLVFTESGKTAQLVSRYRPLAPIFALAPNKKVADSLTLSFGVLPFDRTLIFKKISKKDEIVKTINFLLQKKLIKRSQILIALFGDFGKKGNTSSLRIIEI